MKSVLYRIVKTHDDWVDEYISQSMYDHRDTMILQRVRMAIDFYLQVNIPVPSKQQVFSEINGIDFNQPVEVVLLEENDLVDQIQVADHGACLARKGAYFAIYDSGHPVPASARGIAEDSFGFLDSSSRLLYLRPKKLTTYVVTQPTLALKSTSKSIDDSWSMRVPERAPVPYSPVAGSAGAAAVIVSSSAAVAPITSQTVVHTSPTHSSSSTLSPVSDFSPVSLEVETIRVNTVGGAIQLYVGSNGKANMQCSHTLICQELLSKIKANPHYINQLRIDSISDEEIELLCNQLGTLTDIASTARERGWTEAYEKAKKEIKEIRTVMQEAEEKINQCKSGKHSWFRSFLRKIGLSVTLSVTSTPVTSERPSMPSPPTSASSASFFSRSSSVNHPAVQSAPSTPLLTLSQLTSHTPTAAIPSLQPCFSTRLYHQPSLHSSTANGSLSMTSGNGSQRASQGSHASFGSLTVRDLTDLSHAAEDMVRTPSPKK